MTASSAAGASGTGTITITYNPPAGGSGRNWYVDQNHADATDVGADAGTAAKPFRTLSAGVAAAYPGDTVIVAPGRYTDPNAEWWTAFTPARSGTSSAPITIRAEPARGATLVPRGYDPNAPNQYPALAIYRRQHIVVDGFRAEGMLFIYTDQAPVEQHVTIQNCDVVYGSQQGTDISLNWGIAIQTSNQNILRNNIVSNMRSSGNHSENTAAIMLFAASDNLIENNDADAGNGVVLSAFGQKAGLLFRNTWRRNIARNAVAGFYGKGGTSGATYSDDNVFHENIIVNSDIAFNLNHNTRYSLIYNNTAYNVRLFMNQWQLNSVDNRFWNNIVHSASQGAYQVEDLSTVNAAPPNWSPYISYSDYNTWSSVAATFARWQYGVNSRTLAQWRNETGFDANSLASDPLFVNAAGGDFRLAAGSPARDSGRPDPLTGIRQHMGAYPTGAETIGATR